jgi:hypothetical protein
MNADEVNGLLRVAVKQYGDPSQVRPSETANDAALRQSAAIRDLLDQLSRFVDAASLRDACLLNAERLMKAGQHRAALHACLALFAASQEHSEAAERQRMQRPDAAARAPSEQQRLAALAQATRYVYLKAVSTFHATLQSDRRVEGRHTLDLLLAEAEAIVEAMKRVFPAEDALYHLVHEGTVHLTGVATALMGVGCRKQAAVFLGWCAATLDAVLKLATVRHLPWRVRVYSTICLCYEQAELYSGALTMAQRCLAKVDDLYQLEHSDVVPPSAELEAVLVSERRNVRLLVVKYTALVASSPASGGVGDAGGASADTAKATSKAVGGKAGGKGGAGDAASGVGSPTTAGGGGDFAPNAAPIANSHDLLERVRAALQPLPRDGSPSLLVHGLLICAGGSLERLAAGAASSKHVSAARVAFNTFAAEALVTVLGPHLHAYVAAHRARMPADLPALDAPTAAGDKDEPKGGKAAIKAGGKAAPAANAKPSAKTVNLEATMSTMDDSASVVTLEKWLQPATLANIARTLYMCCDTKSTTADALRVLAAVAKDMKTTAPAEPSFTAARSRHTYEHPSTPLAASSSDLEDAALLATLLAALLDVQQLATGYKPPRGATPTMETMFDAPPPNPFLTAVTALCQTLEHVVVATSASFTADHRDAVEDAAAILMHHWSRAVELPAEHHLSPLVYGTAVRALTSAGHEDVLHIASLATVAAARLEERGQYRDALVITERTKAALGERQSAFCAAHMQKDLAAIDATAETLLIDHAVTTEGGVWLRSVRDQRTLLAATSARSAPQDVPGQPTRHHHAGSRRQAEAAFPPERQHAHLRPPIAARAARDGAHAGARCAGAHLPGRDGAPPAQPRGRRRGARSARVHRGQQLPSGGCKAPPPPEGGAGLPRSGRRGGEAAEEARGQGRRPLEGFIQDNVARQRRAEALEREAGRYERPAAHVAERTHRGLVMVRAACLVHGRRCGRP